MNFYYPHNSIFAKRVLISITWNLNLDSVIGIDPHGIGIEDIILCWNPNRNLTTVSGIGIGIKGAGIVPPLVPNMPIMNCLVSFGQVITLHHGQQVPDPLSLLLRTVSTGYGKFSQ